MIAGRDFELPNGSKLTVQATERETHNNIDSYFIDYQLKVTQDGKPLKIKFGARAGLRVALGVVNRDEKSFKSKLKNPPWPAILLIGLGGGTFISLLLSSDVFVCFIAAFILTAFIFFLGRVFYFYSLKIFSVAEAYLGCPLSKSKWTETSNTGTARITTYKSQTLYNSLTHFIMIPQAGLFTVQCNYCKKNVTVSEGIGKSMIGLSIAKNSDNYSGYTHEIADYETGKKSKKAAISI